MLIMTLITRISALSLTFVFTMLSLSSTLYADSYSVSASVDFPAPQQAAVIDPNLDASTVQTALLSVTGTCEVLQPNAVITIMRNGSVAGSTNCTNSGTFHVNITLREGSNQLIARSASVSALYGPDSQPVVVTLNLPPPPPPVTQPEPTVVPEPDVATQQPETSTDVVIDNQAIDEGVRQNLTAIPTQPFTAMKEDNVTTISFVVDGGRAPYDITVNWGDGTTDTMTVQKPDTYTFKHTYKNAGTYHVNGQVRDVLGAVTHFEYVVVSTKPIRNQPIAVTNFAPKDSVNYYVPIALGALLVVTGTAYYIGKTVGHHPVKNKRGK